MHTLRETNLETGFDWDVTIRIHADDDTIIKTIRRTVYAITLHDATGKADKIGRQETELAGGTYWSIAEVV